MHLLGVQFRDTYCNLEMSLEDMKKLQLALNLVTVNFDGEKPEEVEATEYMTEKFYPALSAIIKEIEDSLS